MATKAGTARLGGRGSDDGETSAALAAAVAEDFTAADGGFAGEETDFAGAFEAVRTKRRLHDVKS